MKFILLFILAFEIQAAEECRPDNGQPIITKFDFNFMGCFNFYALDLGMDAASKKCKILSAKHDFSDKNFSKCIDLFQPSRSAWKADITDKCLELSEKNDFLSNSFEACVNAFSITTAGNFSKEKKKLLESGATKCLELSKKIDFSSMSFVRCFYFYGGNHYPPSAKEAKDSGEIATHCSDKVSDHDFATEKMYQCWDRSRSTALDRRQMVDNCLKE